MEKFYLEIPTIKRKQEALEYLEENAKYHSDFNGTGNMDQCLEGMPYEEWLLCLEKSGDIEYLNQVNRVPSKTYFIIREHDNRIIGMLNVRHHIPAEKLNSWASHIGYGIRPTERQKGYAKIALFLGLLEEQRIGEEKVRLVCTTDNIGSNKTILALGGTLEKTAFDKFDKTMTNYYWINVKDAIKKYDEQYKGYIKRDSI